jgi:hypothetical protein
MTDNPHYVTPEEAKKKVCHQSMGGLLMVQNNVMASEHGCHGPECMAWQWVSLGYFINDQSKKVDQRLSTTHGYCGMVRS